MKKMIQPKKQILTLIAISLFLVGCNQNMQSELVIEGEVINQKEQDEINPGIDKIDPTVFSEVNQPDETDTKTETTSETVAGTKTEPKMTPTPKVTTPTTPKNPKPTQPKTPVKTEPKVEPKTEVTTPAESSKMIQIAYKVVSTESKKIGTACNHYVIRVLELLGFKRGAGFLANDFNIYAKKTFKDYRSVFISDTTELKRHLWSYPSRTGFIFQWKRSSKHGHIAIVERVEDVLYIYHASLNKHTARIEKTTLTKLLSTNSNAGLIVYSELR